MISTIQQKVIDSRVSKCMASKPHQHSEEIPNGGRFICEMFHVKHPSYRDPYYVFDMVWVMITDPRRARTYWREMINTLRDKD